MEWLTDLNGWIAAHLPLVVSVGIPLLTLFVTVVVSYFTTRANSKVQTRITAENIRAQTLQRELSHQLKLADFRQAWINDQRDDLALYTARTWSKTLNEGVEAEKDMVMAQARILMRMDVKDPDYKLLSAALSSPIASEATDGKALFEVGQRILKREWDRLKDDLRAVDEASDQSRKP
jgi:hypothetical protein